MNILAADNYAFKAGQLNSTANLHQNVDSYRKIGTATAMNNITIHSTRQSSSSNAAALNSTFANKYKLAADLFCLNIASSSSNNTAVTRYNSKIGEKMQSALNRYGGTSESIE